MYRAGVSLYRLAHAQCRPEGHLSVRHGYQPQGAIPERDQARALDYRYRLRVRGERAGLNIIIGAQGADKLTEHLVRVGATVGVARDKSTRPAAWRLRDTNGASSRKDNALLATAGVLSESVPNAARHETSHGILAGVRILIFFVQILIVQILIPGCIFWKNF